jgi:hypothetical protein
MRRFAALLTLSVLVIAGLIFAGAQGRLAPVTSTPSQSIVPYAAGTTEKAHFGGGELLAQPESTSLPLAQPGAAAVPQPGGPGPKLVDPELAAPASACIAAVHGVVVPVCGSK